MDSNTNQSNNTFDKKRKNTMYTNINGTIDMNENNVMKRNRNNRMYTGAMYETINKFIN